MNSQPNGVSRQTFEKKAYATLKWLSSIYSIPESVMSEMAQQIDAVATQTRQLRLLTPKTISSFVQGMFNTYLWNKEYSVHIRAGRSQTTKVKRLASPELRQHYNDYIKKTSIALSENDVILTDHDIDQLIIENLTSDVLKRTPSRLGKLLDDDMMKSIATSVVKHLSDALRDPYGEPRME